MTKEKTNLIKTLKDENLRAETHKYTQNLLNNNKQRSLTVPNNNTNIINKIEKNEIKEKNEIIIKNDELLNKKEKETNTEIKRKKKVKKKIKLKKVDKLEKTDKIEKTEKNENGQKYKLLTYKTINEIRNEKNENKNNNDDAKNKNNESKEISKKEESKKNITTSDKVSEKSNNSRRDLLNSLNNLKYNFDNLMEIGVHGNKYLNNKKK